MAERRAFPRESARRRRPLTVDTVVLVAARRHVLQHGFAPEVAEAVWGAMVGAFIDLQLREHRAATHRPAT